MVTLNRLWKTVTDVTGTLACLTALPAIIAAIRIYDLWCRASPAARLKCVSLFVGAILCIALVLAARTL